MDNQHKKIKGYRDLTEQEIAIMNEIKAHGEETKRLLDKIEDMRQEQEVFFKEEEDSYNGITHEKLRESYAALRLAKDHLQTGQMWFVRAVALPDSF
jgi:hypothetical protein